MDKEKQIEEMMKDICRLSKMPPPMIEGLGEWSDTISEYLINVGYRKITENEVVISKKEYERIWRAGWEEGYAEIQTDVRKETAEKILKEFDALQENLSKKIAQLKEPFRRNMNSKEKEGYVNGILAAKSIVTSFRSGLAKQFGVDLGEEV